MSETTLLQTAQRAAQLRNDVNEAIQKTSAGISSELLDKDTKEAIAIIAEIPTRVQEVVAWAIRTGRPSANDEYSVTLAERTCPHPYQPNQVKLDRVAEIVFEHCHAANLKYGIFEHGRWVCTSYDLLIYIKIERDVVLGKKRSTAPLV